MGRGRRLLVRVPSPHPDQAHAYVRVQLAQPRRGAEAVERAQAVAVGPQDLEAGGAPAEPRRAGEALEPAAREHELGAAWRGKGRGVRVAAQRGTGGAAQAAW
jgi:hypothetical protein